MNRTLTIVGIAAIVCILIGVVVFRSHRMQRPEQAARQLAERGASAMPRPTGAASQGPRPKDRNLKDPLAREALVHVGADMAATEIWSRSINNRDLPAGERQDLIEDLNEEGFQDPKRLTRDDLPLILSRIDLIELLAPSAIDDVNAAAFKEAHKDLVNMRDRILSQSPPAADPVAGQP